MKNLTFTLATLALMTTAATAQDVVRIGSEGAYPPYNFINDATGELDGYERALGDMMCERAGLTCEWVINDWDSIIPNLTGGNYDAIMAGMSITEERKQVIAFTQNYLQPEPSAYVALTGAGDDVVSGVVAVQTNTIQASHAATTEADVISFATPDESVAAVRNGEADAVLADKSFLAPIAAESADLEFVGEDVLLGAGIGVGLRQSDTELRETLDAVIAEMKADGSINTLIVEWFGEDSPLF
ncbi:transporter substrate-binding domain-containing protein [Roseicitreum antarcticum]|uniref:Amino acid ABC transporter substrate-binding protein, PAAT family (TC 3.A.1.3.-) n=1 Tax=Roseicitreum antarcticum TaxID=564137 RepID=A0A1H2XRQ6_9RHOB|nr:transporter substrate-binding domain-containing protein [Roseicitreum antarcticum]SDW95592.1 amino acid ABC transporter substrate-binding protein, PAAT family (TC 3.A.1.3.-) [Roseicitreum antarcticum]